MRTRTLAAVLMAALALAGCVSPTSTTSSGSRSSSSSSVDDYARINAEQAAHMDRSTYAPLAPREFALLMKDPDSHKHQKVIIYGEVTQLDSATGTTEFRADTGSDPAESYTENTYITAPNPGLLANVVEKDQLRMFVEVAGSYTYKTQMGGEMTVPQFFVYIIDNLTADPAAAAEPAVPAAPPEAPATPAAPGWGWGG